jgi:hypothetical protein
MEAFLAASARRIETFAPVSTMRGVATPFSKGVTNREGTGCMTFIEGDEIWSGWLLSEGWGDSVASPSLSFLA